VRLVICAADAFLLGKSAKQYISSSNAMKPSLKRATGFPLKVMLKILAQAEYRGQNKLGGVTTVTCLKSRGTDVSKSCGIGTGRLATRYIHDVGSCKDLGVCSPCSTVGAIGYGVKAGRNKPEAVNGAEAG
jgi:hypothetical protein